MTSVRVGERKALVVAGAHVKKAPRKGRLSLSTMASG